MLRNSEKADIERLAQIWLETNIAAHSFIKREYWESNFEMVRDALAESEIYIFEDENGIQGFIGMSCSYIEGLFVSAPAQSRGIGRQLLNHAKALKGHLELSVYEKNERAVRFYIREGFKIQYRGTDENTGEGEYKMSWERS